MINLIKIQLSLQFCKFQNISKSVVLHGLLNDSRLHYILRRFAKMQKVRQSFHNFFNVATKVSFYVQLDYPQGSDSLYSPGDIV